VPGAATGSPARSCRNALVLLAVTIVLTAAQLPARPLTGTGVPVVAARTSRPADQP